MSASRLPLLPFKEPIRLRPGLDLISSDVSELSLRRARIWELSPSVHCSIVGTCLTTGALRQLFAKLNHADAKTASDHELHSRAVGAAGRNDAAGKLLNRMLEKRHEVHLKRFSRVKTVGEVRSLWLEALERGDIPGAYWASLTHPATDQRLWTEVFGEVHMLSHLVGMSNRADIVRLRELERELGESEEKIARQETRIARMAQIHQELNRRIDELEQELRRRPDSVAIFDAGAENDSTEVFKQRLAAEQERSAKLRNQIMEQDQALSMRSKAIQRLEEQCAALQDELTSLEATLADHSDTSEEALPNLNRTRLLYVGGRPKQIEQLRSIVARLGGTLLSHDGGIEDSSSLLPGLVSQAHVIFFPVDCVSHQAAVQAKRLCRDMAKPFKPLRSASVASFLAAITSLDDVPLAGSAG